MSYTLQTFQTAAFTASVAGAVMTVTAVASGALDAGQTVLGAGIPTGTTIASRGTGTGGTGTYNLSADSGTVAPESMTTEVSQDLLVFIALQAWLMDLTGLDQTKLVRELDNSVPEPNGDFVLMQRVSFKRLATNETSYQDDPLASPPVGLQNARQQTEYLLQLDFYGEGAPERAVASQIALKSGPACDFFAPYGISPLYAEDPQSVPFVNGEKSYEVRWTLRIHLQFNPTLTTGQQFFSTATVGVISAETYPL